MKNRFYSSRSKSFLSSDPIGIKGGYNLYAYALCNPLFYIDRFGLGPEGVDTTTWFNPNNEEHQMGRDNSCVDPDNAVANFVEDHFPSAHEFSQLHDYVSGRLTDAGIPDWAANIPTMPPSYSISVYLNFIDMFYDIDRFTTYDNDVGTP